MKPATRQVILLGLLVLGVWFYETMRPVPQPPGILAPDPPRITELTQKARTFVRNDYVYTALAELDARARVLSVERYGRDRESQASLFDVVLGWGRMSDSKTLKNVDVVITGHAATTMTVKDLAEYAEFNKEFLAAVRDAKKAGKSVDDVAANWKMPAKYAGYVAPAAARLKANVQVIFDELK